MSRLHRRSGLCLLLLAAVLAAYAPALLHGGFTWDDYKFVEANPRLTGPEGLKAIWLQPGTASSHEAAVPEVEVHWFPVLYTSFWLERRVWGSFLAPRLPRHEPADPLLQRPAGMGAPRPAAGPRLLPRGPGLGGASRGHGGRRLRHGPQGPPPRILHPAGGLGLAPAVRGRSVSGLFRPCRSRCARVRRRASPGGRRTRQSAAKSRGKPRRPSIRPSTRCSGTPPAQTTARETRGP